MAWRHTSAGNPAPKTSQSSNSLHTSRCQGSSNLPNRSSATPVSSNAASGKTQPKAAAGSSLLGSGLGTSRLSAGQTAELIARLAAMDVNGTGLHASVQHKQRNVLTYSSSAATSYLSQVYSAEPNASRLHELAGSLTFERLRHLAPHQLASVLAAFATLRYDPGEEFFVDFDAACYSHPGPFDAQSTAQILHALATLQAETGMVPSTLSFPSAAPLRVEKHMQAFSHTQLCTVLKSLTRLGVEMADEWLAAVGAHMGKLLAYMDSGEAKECLAAEGCALPDEALIHEC